MSIELIAAKQLLFIAGSTSVVLGITWGGQPYDWASAAVLVPLLVGLALLALFFWFERTALEPTVPLELLANRTAVSGYATVAVHSIVALALFYYLPIYFQAVKMTSAIRSGVNVLPMSIVVAVSAILAGFFVGVTHKYKELNVISVSARLIFFRRRIKTIWQWAMCILGFGLLCLIKPDSYAGIWAGL